MKYIHLKIITPRKVVMEADINKVSVPSVEGEITILPQHANLFALLNQGIVKIKKNQEEDLLAIGGGYVQTDGVGVNILVSKAYGQAEIDEQLTKKALEDAQKILSESKNDAERQEAASVLRRSLLDMRLLRKRKRRVPHSV